MTVWQKWPAIGFAIPARVTIGAALPGPIIERHWPPPDGATSWRHNDDRETGDGRVAA